MKMAYSREGPIQDDTEDTQASCKQGAASDETLIFGYPATFYIIFCGALQGMKAIQLASSHQYHTYLFRQLSRFFGLDDDERLYDWRIECCSVIDCAVEMTLYAFLREIRLQSQRPHVYKSTSEKAL